MNVVARALPADAEALEQAGEATFADVAEAIARLSDGIERPASAFDTEGAWGTANNV